MPLAGVTSLWHLWLTWYSSPVNLVGSIVVGGFSILYIWSCESGAFEHGRRSKRLVLLVQVVGVLTSMALFTTLFVWIGPMRRVRAYQRREDDRRGWDAAPSTPVQNTTPSPSQYSSRYDMLPQRTLCSSCGGRKTEHCSNSTCMGGHIDTGLEGNARWAPCPVCHGTGAINCRACGGTGYR